MTTPEPTTLEPLTTEELDALWNTVKDWNEDGHTVHGSVWRRLIAQARAARPSPWQIVLRRLRDEVVRLSGDPENCEDCGDKSEAGNDEPCAMHRSAELFHAVLAADELLGPCVCGHAVGEHFDEDTTRCKVCNCQWFELPAPPVQDGGRP